MHRHLPAAPPNEQVVGAGEGIDAVVVGLKGFKNSDSRLGMPLFQANRGFETPQGWVEAYPSSSR